MITNAIIIIGILLVVGYIIYYYLKLISEEETYDIPENTYTIDYLVKTVSEIFAQRQAQDPKDMNLSKSELANKEKQRYELRNNLKRSVYGDRDAKNYIVLCIRDLMRKEEGRQTLLDIDETTIDKVIHFNDSVTLRPRDKFEIILHIYKKKHDDKALVQFIENYALKTPLINEDGETYYDITTERLNDAYDDVISKHKLTYSDKLDILAKRIFAQYRGFGASDILFDFALDEIDCGVSGIPKGSFEIKEILDILKDKEKAKNIQYSYKSIWIMVSALKIHLSFLAFDSQKELVRVCQNIYKYDAKYNLSRKKPYVIGTMITGSRIVVVRPPMASSYAFFARKFDSIKNVAPEELWKDENAITLITMLKHIIKGFQNNVISGGMGTGKSTALKSLVRYLSADLAIRIYEITAELNLQYTYPKRNILSLQETESVHMQEELDLGMKLNSDVTIIGEMASEESVKWYVESSRKGSKLAMGTIHTNTVEDLIDYAAGALHYPDITEAKKAVIQAIRFDIHLEKEKDKRFLQRITEIVPVRDTRYPSQKPENKDLSKKDLFILDCMEFMHRKTDRKLFEERDIIVYENGRYVLKNMPSKEVMLAIRNNLTSEEEAQFNEDMAYIKEINHYVEPQEQTNAS